MKTIKELKDWKKCCKWAYEQAKEDVLELKKEIFKDAKLSTTAWELLDKFEKRIEGEK